MPKTKPALKEVSKNTKEPLKIPNQEELTPEGYHRDSEEARILLAQRDFLGGVAKPSFQSAADARRKYDQEWLARTLFWRGYQFSRYMPNSQTVVLSSRQSARIPVNYLASTMRAIRNQVTSFRPKFEVLPSRPNSEDSKNQARYAQRLLDYYFDRLKLKRKIKETIIQALLYSVGGPWQIVYDPITKEVRVWSVDPFDFYIDPLAEDEADAEFVIKATRRPTSEILHNPKYNPWAKKEVTMGDAKIAASEYKQFMIQAIKSISPRTTESNSMGILFEGYFKRRRENGEVYWVRLDWTEQNITPLLYEEIDEPEHDFVTYRGDIVPKDFYGESWAKHVIPLNRSLNSLETSAFEYNYRVAKGRIVVDRDSGVRAIHNVHGEIISKNRGAEVKPLDLPPLPVSVPQQIERMWRYIEDITGVHEASLGRVPTGVKTGIGIAELKQADATSQDDLVDNLEEFLGEVAKKILKKIAKHYTAFKVIQDLGVREDREKYFVAIGQQYAKSKMGKDRPAGRETQVKIGPDWFDVAQIGEENNIRVTIGSWLGYTKEALQQKVVSYFQLGLIDQNTALKLLEFGDTDDIVQQTRIEALLKRAQTTPPQPGQPDQLSLAMTENEMLLEGKDMPVSELDDHMVHIAIHQEALGKGNDMNVGDHLAKHQVFMGQSMSGELMGGEMESEMMQTGLPSQQPAITPGVPPIPEGTPAGQMLPQQNMSNVMAQTQNLAEQALA